MRIQQLLALCHQGDPLLVELLALIGRGGLQRLEVFLDEVFDVVAQFGRQRDGAVLVVDEFLDVLGKHGLPLAPGRLPGSSGTNEVEVVGTPLVACRGDHESGTAVATEHTATQVVLVGALLVAGLVVRRQQVLHLLPGRGVDEGLVGSGVDDAPVVDLAFVVGVVQDLVDGGDAEWLAGPLRCRPRGQAAVGQLVEQQSDGGVALGIAEERPADEVGAFGVDLDCAVDPSQLVGEMHVLVSQGCPVDGATQAGLLDQSLGDLVGQVAGVELGDAAHDAVHQHSGWRLVDVLAGGHQRDPGLLQGEVDGHVVGPRPCQPVELVHDAVVDRVLAHVAEHALQFGPLGR
nr:hypothetical protein [Leekyejoonella antrihumi]